MRVSRTITVADNRLTIGAVRKFVDMTAELQDAAIVSVKVDPGDQRDPGVVTLSATFMGPG